jgi:hypothetical protein
MGKNTPQVHFDGTATISDFRIHLKPGPMNHGDLFATFDLRQSPSDARVKVSASTPVSICLEGLKAGPLEWHKLGSLFKVATKIAETFGVDLA